MKRLFSAILLCAIWTAIFLSGCANSVPEAEIMNDFNRTIAGETLENISLTIYYIDPLILTRKPLSEADLVSFSEVHTIKIDAEKLVHHWTLLRKMSNTILRPVRQESYMNARLYYVFEVGNSPILEVVISQIHGNVFVNGIEMEDDPIFYELIIPFLTDDDRAILGF